MDRWRVAADVSNNNCDGRGKATVLAKPSIQKIRDAMEFSLRGAGGSTLFYRFWGRFSLLHYRLRCSIGFLNSQN